jgi:hypothetical protein
MSSAGGRPSWQKMVSVGTSIVPPGHRPPPEGTPDTSSTATTSQVTASRNDFAESLHHRRRVHPVGGRSGRLAGALRVWYSGHSALPTASRRGLTPQRVNGVLRCPRVLP